MVRMLHPVTEAADLLGVGRTTVYKLMEAGELASVTIARRRLVPHAALEQYVESLGGAAR